ncbi:hypothetical protein LXL04_027547 [Taraxacum kok-saghyz]
MVATFLDYRSVFHLSVFSFAAECGMQNAWPRFFLFFAPVAWFTLVSIFFGVVTSVCPNTVVVSSYYGCYGGDRSKVAGGPILFFMFLDVKQVEFVAAFCCRSVSGKEHSWIRTRQLILRQSTNEFFI